MSLNDSGLFESFGLKAAEPPRAAEFKAGSLGGQSAARNDGGRLANNRAEAGKGSGKSADFASFLVPAAPPVALPTAAPTVPDRSGMPSEAAPGSPSEGLLKAEPEVQTAPALPEALAALPVAPTTLPTPAVPPAPGEIPSEASPGSPSEGLLKAEPEVQTDPALPEALAALPVAPTTLPTPAVSSAPGEILSEVSPSSPSESEGLQIQTAPAAFQPVTEESPAQAPPASAAVPPAAPTAPGEIRSEAGRRDSSESESLLKPGPRVQTGPALTRGPEKIEVPQAPPMAPPTAPTPAPSAGGDEDEFANEIRPEAGRRDPSRSEGLLKPGPRVQARVETGPALTLGPEKNKAPVAQVPQAPPAAHKAPVAQVPTAPTPAPSAGGDEDEFANEIRPEAGRRDPSGSEGFLKSGPRVQARVETGPALTLGPEKNKTPVAQAPQAPPVAPPTAHKAPTVQVSTAPTAPPTPAPSAGGDEGGFVAAGLDQVAQYGQALAETLLAGAEKIIEVPQALPTAPLLNPLQGRQRVSGDWNSLTSGLLARNRLSQAASQALGREVADPAAVSAALDRAKSTWPAPFRKQVGLGLVALGRPGLSANSMASGASLLGAASTGEVLRDVLTGLKGELKILKLPPQARETLGRILADSGVGRESLGRIMAGFGRDGLSLETLNRQLAGLNLSGQGQGLVATEDGLFELGQFLGSLGAPTEAIDQVLNGLKPGQLVTGEILRDILGRTELGGLNLNSSDLRSLAACLSKMGATPGQLEKLEAFLGQTSGQLDSFLDFLDSLKEAPALSGGKLEELKTLLGQISRDDNLARTPVFNEILIKLEALGDSEIDDDFLNLSPALQALRGGISGSEDFAGGQFHGQNRENQERYRQVLQAMATGQDGPVGATVMAAEAEGYGGRSEALNRQIAQKIILSRRRGIHRLKMNLNPAELGRVDIELAVKNGALTAHIRAENRAVYEALGDQVAELKKALAQGGVELAGLTLDHDDAESGQTFTAGLTELTAKNTRTSERPGEVHRVI